MAKPPPEEFDVRFRGIWGSQLWLRTFEEAYRGEFPREAAPLSDCTWRTLGDMVAELRLNPGSILVDIGCGQGGPGCWMARALNCELIGIDHSKVAVEQAAETAKSFNIAERSTFRLGFLDATGLPSESAHGVIMVDSMPFAESRTAVLGEVSRILAPGGRAVITVTEVLDWNPEKPKGVADWTPLVRAAGLTLTKKIEQSGVFDRTERLFTLWREQRDALAIEIGPEAAELTYQDAEMVSPWVNKRRHVMLVCEKLARFDVATDR
ncbi:SAM-dependent methyltransferase [Streptomyces sp. NPDC088354]|uniref:SAM-dependent methyltransferase n=1 Tax=Streptomyces sp. NPDC088354 TaxID=3365856 RepID=UPI0038008B55